MSTVIVANEDIAFFSCGGDCPKGGEHVWDGPTIELRSHCYKCDGKGCDKCDGGAYVSGETGSCSKCGLTSIDHDMRLVWKMNLFEKEEKRRYAEWETERILVAFGKPKPTVVVFAGPAFEYENDEAFTGLEDLLEGDGAPGLGIWVWEGKPRPQFGCGEWGDEFDGYEYDGTWREPTEEELKAGMGGDNPWTIPCPACSNLPETPVEPTEAGAVDTTWKSIPTCKECDGRGEVPRT